MTCIVGLVDDGLAYVGGDSASMSGWDHFPRRNPKAVVRKTADGIPVAIGFTGSWRFGDLLTVVWELPPLADQDPYRWAVREAVPTIRKLLRVNGAMKVKDGVDEAHGALLGLGGRLLEIDSDFQVADVHRFTAIGIGRAQAVGGRDVLWPLDQKPAAKVRRALGVAAKFSGGVIPPFRVVSA